MNCERAQRELLLAESGELSARRARALEGHWAACAACRARRDEWRALAGAMRAAAERTGPRPQTVAAILAAARELPSAARRRYAPVWLWPALAAAAALALLAGGWWQFTRAGHRQRIHDMTALVAVLSEQELPAEREPAPLPREEALRRLAQALLVLEGMTEEEIAEAEENGGNATLPWEPEPIALPGHSIGAPWLRRCG